MKVIYKCENCGEKVVLTAMGAQVMEAFAKSVGENLYNVDDMPKKTAHHCKEGIVGIAKIVGFDFSKDNIE